MVANSDPWLDHVSPTAETAADTDRDRESIMIWDEVTKLVERARTGDRHAFGELVGRFQNAVYAVALSKVRDPNEAQELVQDVFIHAMRKLSQLRDARCFAGWLRQITVRMAINRLTRSDPVRGADQEILENVKGRMEAPLHELERTEVRGQIHEGLSQLKELDRQTLEAFYLRGRSLQQMSREFDAPVGTIKRRLHVARERLKCVLERNGVDANDLVRDKSELAAV
jgi:RNA polymerase sigma-70 factor (ECF subfamily)